MFKKLKNLLSQSEEVKASTAYLICSVLLKCMAFITLPLFTEGMKSNIDWEAWEKLSRVSGSFCYCPDLLMGHRIHTESTTTQIIEDNSRGDEDYFMFRKFWKEKTARFLTKIYGNSENSNKL